MIIEDLINQSRNQGNIERFKYWREVRKEVEKDMPQIWPTMVEILIRDNGKDKAISIVETAIKNNQDLYEKFKDSHSVNIIEYWQQVKVEILSYDTSKDKV